MNTSLFNPLDPRCLRKLVAKAFTPKQLTNLRNTAEQIATKLYSEGAKHEGCAFRDTPLMHEFTGFSHPEEMTTFCVFRSVILHRKVA